MTFQLFALGRTRTRDGRLRTSSTPPPARSARPRQRMRSSARSSGSAAQMTTVSVTAKARSAAVQRRQSRRRSRILRTRNPTCRSGLRSAIYTRIGATRITRGAKKGRCCADASALRRSREFTPCSRSASVAGVGRELSPVGTMRRNRLDSPAPSARPPEPASRPLSDAGIPCYSRRPKRAKRSKR
jgi:hypothetical protein